MSTKKLALIAILVAQATILHYLEGLLPNPIPIPGVKLGLANIITLLALIIFDFKTALNIVVLRTILGSLLNGTLFGVGFFLSFSGAIAATCVMILLLRVLPVLSVIGVSIAGAIAHSIGQLLMAALIISQPGIFYYLPVMLLFSIPSGIITGLLLKELLKFMRSTNRFDQLIGNKLNKV
ncbi:heptaprenyl diphosphate synthase component i [hydrocarbon metagenome]|uniref:Heptaprenyl diphosphate synthase component i n=1 Tax=hydrocarbon metagenome TaxID=938273 RepID=A0A0W8E2Z2_9ZZZZ